MSHGMADTYASCSLCEFTLHYSLQHDEEHHDGV